MKNKPDFNSKLKVCKVKLFEDILQGLRGNHKVFGDEAVTKITTTPQRIWNTFHLVSTNTLALVCYLSNVRFL